MCGGGFGEGVLGGVANQSGWVTTNKLYIMSIFLSRAMLFIFMSPN